MENQQPDPDDLSDESPDGDSLTDAATDSAAAETDPPANTDANSEASDGDDLAGDASPRAHRGLVCAVGVAAALFIGCAAFAGTALQPYLADRALNAARVEVARTAAAAVTTLWTYTPETIDALPDRAAQYLSGDFHAQYRKFVEGVAAPNKQAQVTDSTEVVGVGVESLNGTEAVAIVFTNTTATSPLTKNMPSLKYVGYRLDMKNQGSRWLVTKMATVSFMDLTPQL